MDRILLTCFEGKDNSSELIVKNAAVDCRKLILPNDKEKSAELLRKTLKDKSIVCVVMLGQKGGICDKIAVEPAAKRGNSMLHTPMDVTVCRDVLKNNGYNAYISKGCGNSYCNHIYYECLETGVNCIFLHVPPVKGISDTKKIVNATEAFLKEISGIPAIL